MSLGLGCGILLSILLAAETSEVLLGFRVYRACRVFRVYRIHRVYRVLGFLFAVANDKDDTPS